MSHIPHPLHALTRADPEQVVLAAGEDRYTARELSAKVASSAGSLHAAGVRAGHIVALRGPAGTDFIVNTHAIGWLGATVFPVAWQSTEAERALLLLAAEPHHHLGELPSALVLQEAAPLPAADWSLSDIRALIATSGTTGAPTVVPLTTEQLLLSAFGSTIRLGHLPSDRWLCCLPLHHVGGLSILYRCAWLGTCVELHERFDAATVNAAIERGVTQISVVPTMLERVLDDRSDARFPPHLRVILTGGAGMSAALVERCRAIYAPVSRTWGMTEAGSQVATTAPGDLSEAMPPLPFAHVELDASEGVLTVRGALVQGGLLATRDAGHVTDEGRVVVTGRRDDVIVSGGENIDPTEVESVLSVHPGVHEVAVVGRTSVEWGERPVAFYVGDPVDPDELTMWCRGSLAGFKVPDQFHRVTALPRTALGKVKRRQLKPEAS